MMGRDGAWDRHVCLFNAVLLYIYKYTADHLLESPLAHFQSLPPNYLKFGHFCSALVV